MQHHPDTTTGRRRAMMVHPAGQPEPVCRPTSDGPAPVPGPLAEEEGSLVTEYGLLAVVAATVAGVVIQWASGGALVTLFNALLRHARSLVGA